MELKCPGFYFALFSLLHAILAFVRQGIDCITFFFYFYGNIFMQKYTYLQLSQQQKLLSTIFAPHKQQQHRKEAISIALAPHNHIHVFHLFLLLLLHFARCQSNKSFNESAHTQILRLRHHEIAIAAAVVICLNNIYNLNTEETLPEL